MSGRLRVGIIGAGEVTQVVHLPTLAAMSDRYEVVAICDVSREKLDYVARKWHITNTYTSSQEMVKQRDINLVLVASPDEYHTEDALLAANACKHVFIEKPMALTRDDAKAIAAAASHNKVSIYVAYMRRYAPAFKEFKRLLAESGSIRHVIVKDIIGPNSFFVSQSGTYPNYADKDVPEAAKESKSERSTTMLRTALGSRKASDVRLGTVYRLLGSLGSHDLSFMREALGGKPDRCTSAFASHDGKFISATFEYVKNEHPYSVMYTTGIHNVGVFECFLEVFTDDRILRIDIDTPYVKGLPCTISVKENDARGQYSERIIRPTYQDAYTSEYLDLYSCITNAGSLKTTPEDAMEDLDIFDMIMAHLKPED